MPAVDLDDLARRPQRYWDVDGLPELTMGLLWIVWGGAWMLGASMPHDWRGTLYWLTVPTALVLSGFGTVWATKKLKARLTFPRTGYVEWHHPGTAQRRGAGVVAILAALILAAVLVMMKNGVRMEHSAAPVMTVMLSLAFVVASIRQRAPHYLALAAVAAALALAVASIGGGVDSLNWVFVVLGAASAALGGFRLALFLRKHPRLPMESA